MNKNETLLQSINKNTKIFSRRKFLEERKKFVIQGPSNTKT